MEKVVINMGILEDLAQKMKGHGQQLRGEIKEMTGDKIGGTMDKIKGRANEEMADTKLRTKDRLDRKD